MRLHMICSRDYFERGILLVTTQRNAYYYSSMFKAIRCTNESVINKSVLRRLKQKEVL